MITARNYYEEVSKRGLSRDTIHEGLRKGWDFVDKITDNGKNWDAYETKDAIKSMVNTYFAKLDEFLNTQGKAKATVKTEKIVSKQREQKSTTPKTEIPKREKERQVKPAPTKTIPTIPAIRVEQVERISDEVKFIRRFVNFQGKHKTRNQFRLYINALQKAIRERRIRKDSKYAKEIMTIQNAMIQQFSFFDNDEETIKVNLKNSTLSRFFPIIGRQVELLSVKFIKAYINLQGRLIENTKAANLHNRIKIALNKKKISKKDKYLKQIHSILDHLKTFVKKNPERGVLQIDSQTLNGLEGIAGCACVEKRELNGLDRVPENTVMNSMDVMKLNFEKLGLTGKWLDFIGNPSSDFTAMIFGKPKFGKSILAVDFAGHLALHHGPVLYVAREEGIDDTLQEKLRDAAHPNLFVGDFLPDDLSKYDFIFLDSVTRLALTPEDLNKLKKQYPDKAFIYIFQTTKNGMFRGNNKFQHDVDVVIEVPEKGKAVQYGRFNQGGEMQIFADSVALDGVPKKDYPAWTRPKHMSESDHFRLRAIYDLYKAGHLGAAMEYAMYNSDTAIRDEIPGEIWLEMGGQLTPFGWEKLRARQKKSKK